MKPPPVAPKSWPARWLHADMSHRADCLFDQTIAIEGALIGVTEGDDAAVANYAQIFFSRQTDEWPALLDAAEAALARYGRPPVVAAIDAPADRLKALGWREAHRYQWRRVPLPETVRPFAAESPKLVITSVKSTTEQRAFLDIYKEVFVTGPGDQAWLDGMARTFAPSRNRRHWRHALALYEGEPAGVCAFAHDHAIAGLHALAVRPAFRGEGIGRSLTTWRTLQAAAAGCYEAFLQTEDEQVGRWQELAGLKLVFETVFWVR